MAATPYFYGFNKNLYLYANILYRLLGHIGLADQMIEKNSESNRGRETVSSRPHLARLLLIEDHAELAEATAEFLGTAGLEVRIAKSGEDALQMAITFRPDIVLCDMTLPDMLGIEVARSLRRNPPTIDALLVMHTAMSDTEIRVLEREVKSHEFNLFLSKPITQEKIDRLWIGLAAIRRSTQ